MNTAYQTKFIVCIKRLSQPQLIVRSAVMVEQSALYTLRYSIGGGASPSILLKL